MSQTRSHSRIDDLRCLRFWSKKYACGLRADQNFQARIIKSNIWQERCSRDRLLLWSIMPDFCCAFGCLSNRKTGSKSNISYYRIPFSTDPESLSLRKRWIATIRKKLDRRSNWQLKNIQQAFHQWWFKENFDG